MEIYRPAVLDVPTEEFEDFRSNDLSVTGGRIIIVAQIVDNDTPFVA